MSPYDEVSGAMQKDNKRDGGTQEMSKRSVREIRLWREVSERRVEDESRSKQVHALGPRVHGFARAEAAGGRRADYDPRSKRWSVDGYRYATNSRSCSTNSAMFFRDAIDAL